MIGVARHLARDASGALKGLTDTYGDIVQFNFFGRKNTLLAHPRHVQLVLKDDAKRFVKGEIYKDYAPLIGEGLLSSDGETWTKSRKLITPSFRSTKLADFARAIADCTETHLEQWSGGRFQLDMAREMNTLTFRVISSALLNVDLARDVDTLFSALETGNAEGTARIRSPIKVPLDWPTPANSRYRRAVARLDAITEALIKAREEHTSPPDDFFTAQIEAMKRGEIDRKMVRDQTLTFLFAGHETTSNALAWTFHLLSQNPEVQTRAREEVLSTLNDGTPDQSCLKSLPYLNAVLLEAMRLYPPIYAMQRRALEDMEIDGHPVVKGSGVALSPYITHRHPEFWDEPVQFNPERFLDRSEDGLDRFSYLPFGAGPRVCIGQHLALLEGIMILAMVLQRFEIAPEPGHKVEKANLISLSPKGGLPLNLARL